MDRMHVFFTDVEWKKLLEEINFIGDFNTLNATVGIPQGLERVVAECPPEWKREMEEDLYAE